jgi:hypothetical protein
VSASVKCSFCSSGILAADSKLSGVVAARDAGPLQLRSEAEAEEGARLDLPLRYTVGGPSIASSRVATNNIQQS